MDPHVGQTGPGTETFPRFGQPNVRSIASRAWEDVRIAVQLRHRIEKVDGRRAERDVFGAGLTIRESEIAVLRSTCSHLSRITSDLRAPVSRRRRTAPVATGLAAPFGGRGDGPS